jgi:hypothetical protein
MTGQLALVGNAVYIANFVNAACLLAMQLWAYRRFRHVSFIVLFVASLAALSSVALFGASGVSSLSEQLRVAAYIWGAACYFVYMGLGLWGVLSLFRAYGALAEARQ